MTGRLKLFLSAPGMMRKSAPISTVSQAGNATTEIPRMCANSDADEKMKYRSLAGIDTP
jgi:hypothetical protein